MSRYRKELWSLVKVSAMLLRIKGTNRAAPAEIIPKVKIGSLLKT